MNNIVRREYLRLRDKGWGAKSALDHAKTVDAFKTAEAEGLMRLRVVMDDMVSMDDLKGDVYSHKANPDIPLERLQREEKEFEQRVSDQGAWGIMAEWRASTDDQWEQADAVWGFVGDDWQDSGYDTDVMRGALKMLEQARRADDLKHDALEGLRHLADNIDVNASTTADIAVRTATIRGWADDIRRYLTQLDNAGL